MKTACKLKIDIVVHGRFHAFALAKALIELGQDVVVLTNYPKLIVKTYGVAPSRVRTFLAHGLATRLAMKSRSKLVEAAFEPYFHKAFGKWAARNVRADADLVYGFSGVMEEYLRTPKARPGQIRAIMRGSSHVREQSRILEEEKERTGVSIDRPSLWMIDREEREYALADVVLVLSTFARESFLKWGVPGSRLEKNALGVDVSRFAASAEVVEAREKRILSGDRLRALCVGTFSFQKGVVDLSKIAEELSGRISFRFVGSMPAETSELRKRVAEKIEMIDRVPEQQLAKYYREADLFLFPTLQDGFAAVLAQANAAGLPILTTPNCSASDLIAEGKDGWILPIRDPNSFVERLIWCDENRSALAGMARSVGRNRLVRTWEDMASELLNYYDNIRRKKPDRGQTGEFLES